MQKKKFLIMITVLIWFILICDLVANHYFLYWRFWWTDIVMHFMGGFWLAFCGYYIFYLSGWFKSLKFSSLKEKFYSLTKKYSFLVISLSFVLSISLLWEVFELFFAFPLKHGYVFDTILDLIMDIIGWGVFYFLFLKKVKTSQKSKVYKVESFQN
ncbi:hypothetical protein KJ603_00585 [Patescibacteria group bacterium]|nr:hypothetical protein [Patescibacteria group bacterium]